MSRIGYLPIEIPEGVDVNISDTNLISVKGAKGELTQQLDPAIAVKKENNTLTFERKTEAKEHKAKHGLYRSLVNNMVIGVTEGYKIELEMVGVGYRAQANGQKLDISVGYSHNIVFEIPEEVQVNAITEKRKNTIITLESNDKQLIGHIAAKIRSFRPPEPYKGKGILYVGEQIRRKTGKTVASVGGDF